MTLYRLLFFLHVLFAIAGMGPHFIFPVVLRQMERNPAAAAGLAPVLHRLTLFPRHGILSLIVTGVLMVWQNAAGWALFKETWLALSVVLVILATYWGRARLEPLSRRISALVEQGEVPGEEFQSLVRWTRFNAHIMTAVVVIIVSLMVFKPGM